MPDRHPSPSRPSRRSRQRGAALLEGVIAIPCLVIMVSGVAFVAKVEQHRMDVAAAARERAFSNASSGCGTPGESARPAPEPPPYPGIDPSIAKDDEGKVKNLERPEAPPDLPIQAFFDAARSAHEAGGDLTKRHFFFGRGVASSATTVQLPWEPVTLRDRSEMTLLCNEPAYAGQQRKLFERLRKDLGL